MAPGTARRAGILLGGRAAAVRQVIPPRALARLRGAVVIAGRLLDGAVDVVGHDQLLDLATRGNEALYAVNNVTYTPGCIPCLMYLAAGTSLDWALGVGDIPYTYTIELRDTGDYGILLPPSEIIPNTTEVWAFLKMVAEQIINAIGPNDK